MEEHVLSCLNNCDVTKLLHTVNLIPIDVNTPLDPQDNHSRSVMYYAMRAGNAEATEALILHANGDPNAYINFGYGGMTLFHLACRDNPEMALMILGLGGRADPNKRDRLNGMNALSYAIQGGKMPVIKKLIDEYGMVPTKFDLYDAVFPKNCLEIVRYIEPHVKGGVPGEAFHLACKYGKLDLVRHWSASVDPKKINMRGETALMAHLGSFVSTQYNMVSPETIEFLLQFGADPDVPKLNDSFLVNGEAKKGEHCLDRAVLIENLGLRKRVLDIMFRYGARCHVSTAAKMAFEAWRLEIAEKIQDIAAALPCFLPLDIRIDIAIHAESLRKVVFKHKKKPTSASTCSSA